ncbi:MAG: AmmeMemoRadiSam system radical SAM enzyme, partial [Planctomycetes bacterium]|nr:AmmeMemoRadiSam system radical SAM enzyme [Planctomycetota bacterium]
TYGEVAASNYDPIEKKPLYHFFPGRSIYSIGGWGCNLKCVFCQNSPISQFESPTVPMSPKEVARAAMQKGSVGIAFTYNEPLIAIEYVMDCAAEVRRAGGKNVLVSNGYINPGPLREVLPLIDAVNLDIKGFNHDFYQRLCKGTLDPVMETARILASSTHVEVTNLIIPEENDAVPEMEDLSKWIADNMGKATPVHLTAYHPSYIYSRTATTAAHLINGLRIFRKNLDYVYLGNVRTDKGADTICVNCGQTVIARDGYSVDASGMAANGSCAHCGTDNHIVVR